LAIQDVGDFFFSVGL